MELFLVVFILLRLDVLLARIVLSKVGWDLGHSATFGRRLVVESLSRTWLVGSGALPSYRFASRSSCRLDLAFGDNDLAVVTKFDFQAFVKEDLKNLTVT